MGVLSIYYINLTTDLFYRVRSTFDVDFTDEYSVLIAFGGRFEEVVGIFKYFMQNPLKVVFGASPGEYYSFVIDATSKIFTNSTSYNEPKNYSHVTLFTFLFRYGVLFTVLIYGYFTYLLIKYFDSKYEFYLIYIGILSSSFFGANLMSDPMSWVLIAFFLRFRTIKSVCNATVMLTNR